MSKTLDINCIVFDLDGTLIDSARGIHRCVREVLVKRGYYSFDEEFLNKSIGVHPINAVFARTVKKGEVEACVKEFKQRYARTLTKDAILLDGVKETLDILIENGYKVAIYTLKMRNHALKVLNHFSIKVHDILAGNEIGDSKASGNGLKELLKRLNSTPRKSAIVGDQWSDISAGKNVGMTTIGVLSGLGSFEELNRLKPDFPIGNVSDLVGLLNGVNPNRLG